MTLKTYYKVALTTPLWIPIVCLPLAFFPLLGIMAELLLYSLIYGGPPYLAFLIIVFVWAKKRSGSQLQQVVVFFPLLFALLLLTCMVFGQLFDRSTDWLTTLIFIFFALSFGYAYVGIAAICCTRLVRARVITSNQ